MKIIKIISVLLTLLFIVACSSKKPKNVIIMISDGAGYNHILASDYYQYGKTGKQVYQTFPIKLAMATYSINAEGYDSNLAWTDSLYIDGKWTDSAASATALSTGVMTKNGYLGVDENKDDLLHFSEFIHAKSKKIGTVTTVVACHGTPAGFTIHSPFRKNYPEIFQSMILDSKLSVMFGAGLDESINLPEHKKYYYVGNKDFWKQVEAGNTDFDLDGDQLVDKTLADIDGDMEPDSWQVIRNREEFLNISKENAPKRLLGIFNSRANAQYDRKGNKHLAPFEVPLRENIPSLSEMSSAAIDILDNDKGFWLLIEGGAVDKASHANWKGRTIEEQIDFNLAVERVVEWIESNSSWDETLLIITADHETGHISGQANMFNEIVADIQTSPAGIMPEFYFLSSEHTNSLVPFFAKGVGADSFMERANKLDKVRGKYLHSTDVAKSLFDLFQD